MTPDPDRLRFYVDESALGIGKTLTAARKDVIHVGHPLIEGECPYGALDTEWIPAVARRGLIVITRDMHIRTRPAELKALRDAGLRVFGIGGKDLSTWDWLTRLIRHWDTIEEILRDRGPGPWFYLVNDARVTEVKLHGT